MIMTFDEDGNCRVDANDKVFVAKGLDDGPGLEVGEQGETRCRPICPEGSAGQHRHGTPEE